jgi:CheY-like chemotaxis protein
MEIKRNLRSTGYRVTGTEYGKKAVDLCRRKAFDAIIFDYHLKKDESPTCTALDFIPEIRKVFPITPIILTSATLDPTKLTQGDYDHFLPINPGFWDALPSLVSECLKNKTEQLEFRMN